MNFDRRTKWLRWPIGKAEVHQSETKKSWRLELTLDLGTDDLKRAQAWAADMERLLEAEYGKETVRMIILSKEQD